MKKSISPSHTMPFHHHFQTITFVSCATTTDVCFVLIHVCRSKCLDRNTVPMVMSSLAKDRAVVDILASPEVHSEIADDILGIHILSGA